MKNNLIRVERVDAFVIPTQPYVPVISCTLEDGRQFNLYYVPLEIVVAINKLLGENYDIDRESIFDVLPMIGPAVKELEKTVSRVIIDELDYSTFLYSATLEIRADGAIIKKKMIPSHAIYLALLTHKPIYVAAELVEQQEELSKSRGEQEV